MKNDQHDGPWTRFMDMSSGGGTKEAPYEYIYIQATEAEAKVIFYNRFGHNPERVTCTCCGEDYSIDESDGLDQASGYDRGCDSGYLLSDGTLADSAYWHSLPSEERRGLKHVYVERPRKERLSFQPFQTVEEYVARPEVLIIYAQDIKADERVGEVPTQGYVWQD